MRGPARGAPGRAEPGYTVAVRLFAQLIFYAVNSLGAYAALNLLLVLAAPVIRGWPIAAATAVTVPPMVVVMVHIVVPVAVRLRLRVLVLA